MKNTKIFNSALLIMFLIQSSCARPPRLTEIQGTPAQAISSNQLPSQTVKFYKEMGAVTTLPKIPAPTRVDAIFTGMRNQMETQYNVWFDRGDFLRSIQSLRIAQSFFPISNDLTTSLGWMLENVKKDSQALAVYRKYRLDFPNYPDAAFPEGFYYFRFHKYADCVRVLAPTLKTKGRPEPNAYRILAHAYFELHQYQNSLDVWNAYLKLVPDDLTAKHNQREVLREIGNGSTAK